MKQTLKHYSSKPSTRVVFGTLLDKSSNAALRYRLIHFTSNAGVSSLGVYPSRITSVTTDENGYFDVSLAIPNGVAEQYTVLLPSGEVYFVTLMAECSKQDFSDLLSLGINTRSQSQFQAHFQSDIYVQEALVSMDLRLKEMKRALEVINGS